MALILAAAWLLQKLFSLGGLAVALAGLAKFGWHFIRINALAAQGETGEIPPDAWRGKGARTGLLMFATGVALAILSMILSGSLPSRY